MLSAASTFRALQGALKAWELVQVELHGSYSLQRLCDFYFHSSQIGWHRVLFWCVWTPIPCLAFNIAMDIAPLADPSAGRDANYMFWIRCVFVVLPIAYGIFMQIGYLTPNLDMTRRDALATSIVLTSVCVPYAYAMAGYISMPTPFLFLMAAPPFMCSTVAMFGVLFGKKLMRDLELRWSLFRAIVAVNSQVMLNLVYLAYIYGFNSIPESYQSSYLVLITVIKIAAKNAMSKLVGHMDDLKPEIITFNIDVFHALHVSLAMQRATTISTSVVVMIIDSAQACVSIYDVYIAFQFLKGLIDSIPHEHPLHGKNFLEVAMALHQGRSPNITQSTAFEKRRTCYTHPCAKGSNTYPRLGQIKPNTISVVPVDITGVTVSRVLPIPKLSTHDTFSNHSEAYLHAARRLLFMVEFIMLTEYAEVVIPVFYSIYTTAIYNLPNRKYYSAVAAINEQQIHSSIISILGYAGLELSSLVVLSFVLYRITGLPPMQQVGFVLERQNIMVQCKLFSWVLYTLQNSLEHFGADFSFKFAWQHSNTN